MRGHLFFRALVFVTLAAGTVPVYSHHSFAAQYFESESVTMEGDVVEFALRAPHAWLYFTAADREGRPRRYGAEWANPTRLARDGVAQDTFQPGDRVSITGSPGRNESAHEIHLKQVTRVSRGEWRWEQRRRR